jgi:hypothetical protein
VAGRSAMAQWGAIPRLCWHRVASRRWAMDSRRVPVPVLARSAR